VRIVLATHNAGKLRELRALLSPRSMEVTSLAELDIPAPEETGLTFLENALTKARHAAELSTLPAIADDSGLVVPALGGEPGIHSARYAGLDAGDAANNARLLRELHGATDRSAHYYCALVMLRHARDPAPLVATARWFGRILEAGRGTGGFGYDPYFEVAGLDYTAAELPPARKNALSHRGRAMLALLEQLDQEQ
jgi:XTP/dITP diphosphohydrolase